MPNLVVKKLKDIKLPFEKDGVKFKFRAKGRVLDFIFCEVENVKFFISIKDRDGKIVVKGEKLSKPTNIGLLQKALKVFKESYCEEIVSEAILLENPQDFEENRVVVKTESIFDEIKNSGYKQVFIEIGFGTGRHLLYQAKINPEVLVIGIEVYKPVIKQVYKLALKANLQNVRLINADARVLFEMMQSNVADKIFLHFPIPWGEDIHRRVVGEDFAKFAQKALKKDGTFELRSDSFEYTTFTIEQFLKLDKIRLEVFKDKDLQVSSKYEDRWKRQDKNIFDVIVTNSLENLQTQKSDNLEFPKLNPREIYDNFKNVTYKFDDFFIHFEDKYKISQDDILIRLSFGSFNWPNHCYIRVNCQKSEYFIKEPLPTQTNIKAHKRIVELLNGK